MNSTASKRQQPAIGIWSALLSAVLFGVTTPIAKVLLGSVTPTMLAGLFYLGSGIGLSGYFAITKSTRSVGGFSGNVIRVSSAIVIGGVAGPVLLMIGLHDIQSSSASLLLNLETVLTASFAWIVFRESFDRRIVAGMLLIVSGGIVLSFQATTVLLFPLGSLFIFAACVCWAVDNNLMQKVSAADPVAVAAIKGMVAGVSNLILACILGFRCPTTFVVSIALFVGFIGYGISFVLFIYAMRHLGTARTAAYFSLAPFVGAIVSVVILHETFTPFIALAGVLMGIGLVLHLTERHIHDHEHVQLTHSHHHAHDEHHEHEHGENVAYAEHHEHVHIHEPLVHQHSHFPDIHHRHRH